MAFLDRLTPYKPHALLLARLLVGGVYLSAGYAKLMEPMENFRGLLTEYTILPAFSVSIFAQVLPWFEFVTGALLIAGVLPQLAAVSLAFLSCCFVLVLALSKIMLGTLPNHCGCFGEGGLQLTVIQVMILDIVMVFLGLRLFIEENHPWSLEAKLKG